MIKSGIMKIHGFFNFFSSLWKIVILFAKKNFFLKNPSTDSQEKGDP